MTKNGQLRALALLFSAVVAGCGGGGGDAVSASPSPAPAPADPEVTLRWVSSATHNDLNGEADPGVLGLNGRLVTAQPATAASAPFPAVVDSASVRVSGGTVSSDGRTVANVAPKHVLFDARLGAGVNAFGLHRLSLGAADAATPAPSVQRVSSDVTMCRTNLSAPRFTVVGQSLDGTQAVITYAGGDASGSCAGGGVPKLAELSMAPSATPYLLPTEATQRFTAVAAVHNGMTGRISEMLAWRNDALVRVSPRFDSDGAVRVAAMPAPVAGSLGHITPTGIFIRSDDGLRRFDKLNNLLSGVLITGHVGTGLFGVNAMHDERDLYISALNNDGSVDLHRVSDQLTASATKLNTEGPITEFWVLKSHVLYAVDGREGYVAYNKTTRERRVVLTGKRIVLASTLHDRVFHATASDALASSEFDGSAERSHGAAQLVGGSIAERIPAHARSLRGNGAFSHALVASRAAGAAGLAGGRLQWMSFATAADDVDAGSFPSTGLSLGPVVDAPGVFGNAVLLGVGPADAGSTAAPTLFVARRVVGSLAQVNR